MTSYICDVTTALLKYAKYIEKLKLTAQAVHMQITMFICVNRTIEGLYYVIFSLALSTVGLHQKHVIIVQQSIVLTWHKHECAQYLFLNCERVRSGHETTLTLA